MKAQRNIRLVVFFVVVFFAFLLSFSVKAQLDTAYVGREYIHQYTVPHLIDPTLETYYWEEPNIVHSGHSFTMFYFENPLPYSPENPMGGQRIVSNRLAQRYDVQDSITLSGIAILTSFLNQTSEGVRVRDTVRVGILDTQLNTVYEQSYISGGNPNGNYWELPQKAFTEFVFDETVTIHDDYYFAFVESSEVDCDSVSELCGTHFSFAYKPSVFGSTEIYSCGYGTKYKPYIGRCDTREGGWFHVDEITDWQPNAGYCELAYGGLNWDCEPAIYPPAGIFPIRALENSSIEEVVGQRDVEESASLYPNPAKGFVRVDSESNIVKIEVYNVLNQLVETLAANSKTLTLDLKSYTSGTYFAKITTDIGTTTKKFVVE